MFVRHLFRPSSLARLLSGVAIGALALSGLVFPMPISQATNPQCAVPWCDVFSGTGTQHKWDSALTSEGAQILVGSVTGNAVFGDQTLNSAGSTDGFVVSVTSDGETDWAIQFSGPGSVQVTGVTISGNNIVVVGSFEGSMVVADTAGAQMAGTAESGFVSFVASLTHSGVLNWFKQFGGHDGGWPSHDVVTSSSDGNIFLVGHLNGEKDLAWGGSTYTFDAGSNYGSYLTGLTADGTWLWSRGLVHAKARAIAFNDTYGLYVSGHFNGSLSFDDGTVLYPQGSLATGDSGFVLQTDAIGDLNWSFEAVGGSYLYLSNVMRGAKTLAVAEDGSALFLGQLMKDPGALTLGDGANAPTVSAVADVEGIAITVDASGRYLWHATLSGNQNHRNLFTGATSSGASLLVAGTHDSSPVLTVNSLDTPLQQKEGGFVLRVSGSSGAVSNKSQFGGDFSYIAPIAEPICYVRLTGTLTGSSGSDFDPDPDSVVDHINSQSGFMRAFYTRFLADSAESENCGPPIYETIDDATAPLEGDFGAGGAQIISLLPELSLLNRDIAAGNDGKLIVAGWSLTAPFSGPNLHLTVAQLNADGTVDQSFGTDGIVTVDEVQLPFGEYNTPNNTTVHVAATSNNRILVAASAGANGGLTLIRLDAAGDIDSTFGEDGIANPAAQSGQPLVAGVVSQDASGAILVVGQTAAPYSSSQLEVVKLSTDGVRETSYPSPLNFDTGSAGVAALRASRDTHSRLVVMVQYNSVDAGECQQPGVEDEMVILGTRLVRLLADGSQDTTFGVNGEISTPGCPNEYRIVHFGLPDADTVVTAGSTYRLGLEGQDLAAVRTYDDDGTSAEDIVLGVQGAFTLSDLAISPNGTLSIFGTELRYIEIGGNQYGVSHAVLASLVEGSQGSTVASIQTDIAPSDAGASYPVSSTFDTNGDLVLAGTCSCGGGYSIFVTKFVTGPNLLFDPNGADSGSVPAALHGLSHLVPANSGSLTRTGFVFKGWNSSPDGSGTEYLSGATLSILEDTTLYASWNAVTPTTSTTPPIANPTTTTPANTTIIEPPTLDIIEGLPTSQILDAGSAAMMSGAGLIASAAGFTAGEQVLLVIASEPQIIGTGLADSSGAVEIHGVIPATLPSGDHTLALYAPGSGIGFQMKLFVNEATLPATGTSSSGFLTMMMAVVIGLLMLILKRAPVKRSSY